MARKKKIRRRAPAAAPAVHTSVHQRLDELQAEVHKYRDLISRLRDLRRRVGHFTAEVALGREGKQINAPVSASPPVLERLCSMSASLTTVYGELDSVLSQLEQDI